MLPLIPFAAGIAVGSLLTYGAKDKAVRERIVHGAEDAYDRAKSGMASLWASVPELGRAKAQVEATAAEMREGAGEVVEAAAEKSLEAAEKLEEAAEELRKDA